MSGNPSTTTPPPLLCLSGQPLLIDAQLIDCAAVGDAVAQAAIALGKKMGVKVKEVFWTLGPYDTVVLAEARNDETITAYALSIGARGSVKTLTMRAFQAREFGSILRKLA